MAHQILGKISRFLLQPFLIVSSVVLPYRYSEKVITDGSRIVSGRLTELPQLLFCSILQSSIDPSCYIHRDQTPTSMHEDTTILQRFHLYQSNLRYSEHISLQVHAINALLIYLLLRKYLTTQRPYSTALSGSCATLVAILFAVHPCHKLLIKSGEMSRLLSLSFTLMGLLPYLSLLSSLSPRLLTNADKQHNRSQLQRILITLFQLCVAVLCFTMAAVYNIESIGIQIIILFALIIGSTVVYISSKSLYIPAFLCPLLVFALYSVFFYSKSFPLSSSSPIHTLVINSLHHSLSTLFNYIYDQPASAIFLKTAYRMSYVIKQFFRLGSGSVAVASLHVPSHFTEMNMSTIYELAGVITLILGVVFRLTSATLINLFRFQTYKVSSLSLLTFSLFALCLVQDIDLSTNAKATKTYGRDSALNSCTPSMSSTEENGNASFPPSQGCVNANVGLSGNPTNVVSSPSSLVSTYFPHAFIVLYAGTGLADAWAASAYRNDGRHEGKPPNREARPLAIELAYIFLIISAILLGIQTMYMLT